jgi:hypothetical protein
MALETKLALLRNQLQELAKSGVSDVAITSMLRESNIRPELIQVLQNNWNETPWIVSKWLDTVSAVGSEMPEFNPYTPGMAAIPSRETPIAENVRGIKERLQLRALYYRLRQAKVSRQAIFAAFKAANIEVDLYISLEDVELTPTEADSDAGDFGDARHHQPQSVPLVPQLQPQSQYVAQPQFINASIPQSQPIMVQAPVMTQAVLMAQPNMMMMQPTFVAPSLPYAQFPSQSSGSSTLRAINASSIPLAAYYGSASSNNSFAPVSSGGLTSRSTMSVMSSQSSSYDPLNPVPSTQYRRPYMA